jgi:pimeloyl-ACP methyl ester carboxylesterase
MSASGVTERYVVAGGVKARYLERGTGFPVLLLHGGALGSSADVWERNLGPLASHGLRPIALDLPGYGGTEAPPELTESFRRRLVLELLDGLRIERAGIVGHSSAGGLALGLGFEHPDRVTRVLILGTHSLLPPPAEGESDAEGHGAGGGAGHEPTIDDVRAVLEEQLYDHSLITPEVLETRLRMGTRRPRAEAGNRANADRAAERARSAPLWERLGQLPVPLAMMYGANDRPSTARRVAVLQERYPSLDIRLLDHCAHIIQWDAADEFIAMAGAFFRV